MIDIHGEEIEDVLEEDERKARETKAYFQANIDNFKLVPKPKERPKLERKYPQVKAPISDETRRKWEGR